MPVKLTPPEIQRRIIAKHESNVLYTFPKLDSEVFCIASEVTLVCAKHGESTIKARSILYNASGCNECGVRKARKYDNHIFEEKSRTVHGEKYDYTKVVYARSQEKVTIVCREHGPWNVTPSNHLVRKSGCPRCGAQQGVINSTPSKTRNLKSSKSVTVDGFVFHTDSSAERRILPKICAEYGPASVRDQDHTPLISYQFRGGRKLHRPDFFIPSTNTLIEVKSPATMGLTDFSLDRNLTPNGTYEQVRAKAIAAISGGYVYRVFVVARGKCPIELPENWTDTFHSPEQLKQHLASHHE